MGISGKGKAVLAGDEYNLMVIVIFFKVYKC